ncbi:MAG TPA: extracellular solute-binding protein [Streptosporangiaceae bacterium]|jgi:multiple sugar transport system substrate-binding protein
MRRGAAGTLIAAIVAMLAASCTSASPSPWPRDRYQAEEIHIISGADSSISPGNSPVVLGEPGMYEQLVNYWNKYEEPRFGFGVELDVVPGGATAEHSEMLAAAQTGGSQYDIYNLDSQWVPEFADDGYIMPLQGRVGERPFLTRPLLSAEASGQLYAVPFTTDVGLLYYRSDLVTKAELRNLNRRSFGALISLARSVMGRHPAGITEGYAGQFASYEGLTVNALEAIWSRDPTAFSSDGTIDDNAKVTAGLQDLVNAFAPLGQAPAVIRPAELTYQEEQAFADFASGQAVFMRNWPIYYDKLAAQRPSSEQAVADFGVEPLPFPSALGGQDLAISAGSPDPHEALEVVNFLTSQAAERCLFAVGGFPATRASAYAQNGSLPQGAVGRPSLCGTKALQEVKIGGTILTALKSAIPRPSTRYYTVFTTVLQDQVHEMLKDHVQAAATERTLATDLISASTGHAPPDG